MAQPYVLEQYRRGGQPNTIFWIDNVLPRPIGDFLLRTASNVLQGQIDAAEWARQLDVARDEYLRTKK